MEAGGGGKPPCTLAASGPSAAQPALDSANKSERLRLCWARAEHHHLFSAQMGRGLAEDAGCACSYVCVRARAGGTRLSAPPCLHPLSLKLSRTRMVTAYSSAPASHTTVLRKASAACIPYTESRMICASGWVSVRESIPHLVGRHSDAGGTKCPPPLHLPLHPRTWCPS